MSLWESMRKGTSFLGQWFLFRKLERQDGRFPVKWKDLHPCLKENTSTTSFDEHYIYHPAWAFRILARTRPERHTDISSSLAFVSLLSAWIPVDFYDFRPAPLFLGGLNCRQADLLRLPFSDESISSLSCMHVIEHIGLGRYGDSLNAGGDIQAADELKRVLAPGGNLLVAVPIAAEPRCCFNAHRIYSWEQVLDMFSPLCFQEGALIPDDAIDQGLIPSPRKEVLIEQRYACGCFWFRKETESVSESKEKR